MDFKVLWRTATLLALSGILCACSTVSAGAYSGYTASVSPPPLPYYAQPPCPAPGYIWIPGHWAWGNWGYYWDAGFWELPPQPGLLWTPGYWRWTGDDYAWLNGHWGLTVGYYGDVNYGFGYDGRGFDGGYWDGDQFYYNTRVWRLGPHFDGHDYRGPRGLPYHRFWHHHGGEQRFAPHSYGHPFVNHSGFLRRPPAAVGAARGVRPLSDRQFVSPAYAHRYPAPQRSYHPLFHPRPLPRTFGGIHSRRMLAPRVAPHFYRPPTFQGGGRPFGGRTPSHLPFS